MRRGLLFLTISLLTLISSPRLAAQGDVFLDPEYLLPLFVGPEFGFTMWQNQAEFTISDRVLPCAVFGDSESQGPTYGIRGLLFVDPIFFISPRVRYEQRTSSFISPLEDEPTLDGSNVVTTLHQEAEVNVTMSSITIELRGGIDIFESGVTISAGPAINLLNASYDYSERILGPSGFLYTDSRSSEHTLVSGRSFDGFESMAFDIRAGIGYLVEYGPLGIHPEVNFSFPLTSYLEDPETLKQTGISGSLGLLFNFGD